MTSFHLARPGVLGRIVLALLAPMVIASCSSNVTGGPPVADPTRITILPDTAVLYSGLATTFTISGGTGAYIVSSSNQAVIPVSGTIERNTLTVVPANVAVDTPVTLTVRDSGTAPLATASLTVRPGTVNNTITVTPTATQGGNCAPAVCSGGDAIISAALSQGGNPLPARGVRLDVVSGDFRFITSQPGFPEVLETATSVITDQAGGIHVRIRVLPGAPNQTAVFRVLDLGSQAFQRSTFTIAQATGTSPGFFTVPDTIAFTGPNNTACAIGARQDVSIFGGSPPYTIGNGGTAFSVSQNSVNVSGGAFYIIANGACATNIPIPVVDSAGRLANVTVSNEFGTNAIPDLLLSPEVVTLSDCSATASVTVAGGIPNAFTVSSVSGAIIASPNPSARIISIQRAQGVAATSPLSVGVASGDKVATITVNLTGDALNTRCDGSTLSVNPSVVQFAGCGFVDVVVSGGVPPYAAVSNNSSLTASMFNPNIARIQRVNPSPALTAPGTVTVFDSQPVTPRVSRNVTVTVSGSCP